MRKIVISGVAAIVATGVFAVPVTAARADTPGAVVSGTGQFTEGGQLVAAIDFAATRTGTDPSQGVAGNFTGTAMDGVIALAGPVTCLDVQGKSAGFLYPAQYANPSALQGDVVLITVAVNADGSMSGGFQGPAPAAAFNGCQPSVTPFTYTGSLSISGSGPTAPSSPTSTSTTPPATATATATPAATFKPAILAGSRKLSIRRGKRLTAPVYLIGSGRVAVAVDKYVAGKRHGSSCLVATGPVKKGLRCKAHKPVANASAVSRGAGAQKVGVPVRKLGRGGYFVTFALVDSAGHKLSQVTEPLTIS